MALPAEAKDRQLRHRRSIDVQVYACGGGRWQVDARLSDVKTYEVVLGGEPRASGAPIHEMLLRLVIDESFNILEAGSESLSVPYPGYCDSQPAIYAHLVGLNLMQGFRRAVQERVGGVRGCTHLTELSQLLPTAVIQAFAGDVIDTQKPALGAAQPFQIDRCHALRADGDVVAMHYPRWFRPAG
jgi:hypothetical protein